MSKEEEYKMTLVHVAKWLGGESEFDMFKPLNAGFANQIRNVCIDVIEGVSLEEAINKNN